MLAAFKRVQYYEIKAYSGHFYTPKSGKAAFCGTLAGPRVQEKRDFASSPTRFLKDMRTFVLFQ